MSARSREPCRLCFEYNASQIEICKGRVDGLNISSMISKFFNFKVKAKDALPSVVCNECLDLLRSFYFFIVRVKEVQKELKKSYFKKNIETQNSLLNTIDKINIKQELPLVTFIKPESNKAALGSGSVDKEIIFKKELEIDLDQEIINEESEIKLEDYTKSDNLENENITELDDIYDTVGSNENVEHEHTQVDFPSEIYKDGKLLLTGQKLDKILNKFYNLYCDICDNNVDHKTHQKLFLHFTKSHGKQGYVSCCGKQLKTRYNIISHMVTHLQPQAFQCLICKKSHQSQNSLVQHMKRHMPDSKKKYRCDQCDKGFIYLVLLNSHKESHVPVEKRTNYDCTECDKKFTLSKTLKTHMRTVHSRESFLCPECGRAFKVKSRLDAHMVVHDPNGDNCVQCQQCHFLCKSKYSLMTHMKQHLATVKRKFCKQCDYSATTIFRLKKHMRVKHCDEKPFVCVFCHKGFKLKSCLESHMATHTGNRKYACNFCPRTFADSGNYYVHRKRMHPEQLEEIMKAKQLDIQRKLDRMQNLKENQGRAGEEVTR